MKANSPQQVATFRQKAVIVVFLFLALGVMIANLFWPGQSTFFVSIAVAFIVVLDLRMIMGHKPSIIPSVSIGRKEQYSQETSVVKRNGKTYRLLNFSPFQIGSKEWRIFEKLVREGKFDLLASKNRVSVANHSWLSPTLRRAEPGWRYIYCRDSIRDLDRWVNLYWNDPEFN